MVERGSLLPDSAMGLTSGEFAARSPKDPASGMVCETATVVDGCVVFPDDLAAFNAYPTDDVRRELFREGWRHAMHGFLEPCYFGRHKMSACERIRLEGFDSYSKREG